MAQATTNVTATTASATIEVDATPEEVFEFIRRPANHPIISGDGSVQEARKGAEVLGEGDKFGMAMKMGIPYRVSSTVVEYESNAKIAWCHFGKHRWRWEMEATADGKTKVTETFDMGPSFLKPALKLAGYPKGHEANVKGSVENVAKHFAK